MAENQIKLLTALAVRIKKEKRDKATALATLQAAKILNKDGEFTKHYPALKKVTAR